MKYQIALLVFFSLLISSCEDDKKNPIPPTGNMVINLSDLPQLMSEFVYVGWLEENGTPFSIGSLNLNDTGDLRNSTVPVSSEVLESASGFFISIERKSSSFLEPSGVILLGGTFDIYEANLSIEDQRALGADFKNPAEVQGNYLINSPTTDSLEDDTSGIWFINNSSGSFEAGLSLPALPDQWYYESWISVGDNDLSMGKFRRADTSDESCQYCGPLEAPNFPGEDFITNGPIELEFPLNLSGIRAWISLVPGAQEYLNPNQMIILEGVVPPRSSLELRKSYPMQLGNHPFPSGKVIRFDGFDCTNDGCI